MALSLIITAIVTYLLVMLLIHEVFKKFFHFLFFIGTALVAVVVIYFMAKGF